MDQHQNKSDLCQACNGLGRDCELCKKNDAYCTKCALDPKRVAGNDVKYIIRTNSFIEASERCGASEMSNKKIIAQDGPILTNGLAPPACDHRRFSMNRSQIIKISTIKPGTRLDNFYSFSKGSSIGKGSYGTVTKVRCLFSEQVRALKTVSKAKIENITRLKREILIMKRLDHPGIIRLHEVFEDDDNLFLIMELCTGGELFDRVIKANKFSEQYSAKLIKQILSVLAYIHTNNIIHRDIKPENILFIDAQPSSKIKVIDWGFALKCHKSHSLSSVVGTPYYVAPEVLAGNYGRECDIWSVGVILYITLCGYPPFYGQDNKEILKKVKAGEYTFDEKHWDQRSKNCKRFITRLLEIDAKKRITAQEALNENWIRFFAKLKSDNSHHIVDERLSNRLALELYTRFYKFAHMNPIKRLAVTAAAYMISGRDLGQSTQIFNVLDRNSDGILSRSEILQTMADVGFYRDDLDQILALMDTDGNGTIDYTEFLAATIENSLYVSEKLSKVAFRVFDTDFSGTLSAQNLFEILKSNYIHQEFSLQSVYKMMEGLTATAGVMTFPEFQRMLATTEKGPLTFKRPAVSSSSGLTRAASMEGTLPSNPAMEGTTPMPPTVYTMVGEVNTDAPKKSSLMSGLNRAKTLLRKKERVQLVHSGE